MTHDDLAVINALDDGSLYAAPNLIEELFNYPYLSETLLLVSRDAQGVPTGYLPLGIHPNGKIISYIAAIPSSPPISPTYTPGALNVMMDLGNLLENPLTYFDVDVVADFSFAHYEYTASAYCLTRENYLAGLSRSRRKDVRRKLKVFDRYDRIEGDLRDVLRGWPWMKRVWTARGGFAY